MPAPYRADEMAAAIQAAAREAGLDLARVEVLGDERAGVWVVRTWGPGGERRLTFPFASARGLYTPAEVARLVVGDGWPFA